MYLIIRMSYSVWASFVNYLVGDIASYNGVIYEALQVNTNVLPTTLAPNWQVLPGSSGGVTSLEGLAGAVTLSVVGGGGTYANVGNDVQLTFPVVSSLDGLTGAVTQSVVGDGSYANVGNDVQLTINSPFVTGMIILWADPLGTGLAPTGWAFCEGGPGNPDLRNRFVVGAGGAYTLNDTGGADDHLLTLDNLPDHTHDGTGQLVTPGTSGTNSGGGFSFTNGSFVTGGIAAPWVGGTPVPTIPPYYALYYIIKL